MSETAELMLKFINAQFPEEADRDVLAKTLGVSTRAVGINARHLQRAGEIQIHENGDGKTFYLAMRPQIPLEEQVEFEGLPEPKITIDDVLKAEAIMAEVGEAVAPVEVIDNEVAAIQICVEALRGFDEKTVTRVIAYLQNRLGENLNDLFGRDC